jgi:hypothetical protein|tara:strand:- start:616 stop:825 length:210 start_codon:yes stop_codon:yes gene_type:complete
MVLNIEEEAKRFIALKKREFVTELDKMYTTTSDYLVYHLHPSDEREYAIKALQEAVLWSKSCLDKHGIQ